MRLFVILLLLFVALMSIGCWGDTKNNISSGEQIQLTANPDKVLVDVFVLKTENFKRQIISNGKLAAIRKATLQFESSETIKNILVKNGSYVEKRQPIAELDKFKLMNSFQKTQADLQNARLQYHDLIIGHGYSVADTANIPDEVLNTFRIRSGYNRIVYEFQMAKYRLEAATLIAPFAGKIANLTTMENNKPAQNNYFCMLIDDSEFVAEFPILEHELNDVKTNMPVRIIPFAADSVVYSGIITQINPMVNINGQILVKANIKNTKNKLLDGMNVKAIIEIEVENQLMIPKQAVVMRAGKEVVFTYENGLAKWNYVKTGFENITSYSIVEGLEVGDSIITDGNLNLGHDAEVRLIEN